MRPVTIAVTGGLGNQLFQFAAAVALADATGREVRLCVRMYDRRMLRRAFVAVRGWVRSAMSDADGRFRLGAMRRSVELAAMQRVARVCTNAEDSAAGLSRRTLRALYRDPDARLEGVRVLRSVSEMRAAIEGRAPIPAEALPLIAGFMQGDALAGPIMVRVRQAIRWPETPYVCRWRAAAHSAPTVGVHVRRGDYLRNAYRNVFPVLPAEWYRQAAELLVARHGPLRFLVVTDEPAWARANLRLPGPVDIASGGYPASPQEDLAVLASCRHHVIANSTFSWWGARLAEPPDAGGDVIAPTTWHMNGEPLEPGYLPASWTTLENAPSRR
jgi:hypothetical protein